MESSVRDPAADTVMHALVSVARLVRQRSLDDTLDPGTFWLLKIVRGDGSLRVTDLAAQAGLDTSTVSRHVAQLQRAGWLERSPDPDDRRAQRVSLTLAGHERLDEAIDRRRAMIARSLAGWEETDVAELDRLLHKLVAAIETPAAAHDAVAGQPA